MSRLIFPSLKTLMKTKPKANSMQLSYVARMFGKNVTVYLWELSVPEELELDKQVFSEQKTIFNNKLILLRVLFEPFIIIHWKCFAYEVLSLEIWALFEKPLPISERTLIAVSCKIKYLTNCLLINPYMKCGIWQS